MQLRNFYNKKNLLVLLLIIYTLFYVCGCNEVKNDFSSEDVSIGLPSNHESTISETAFSDFTSNHESSISDSACSEVVDKHIELNYDHLQYGTSPANAMNGGFLAVDAEWIYYHNSSLKGRLYGLKRGNSDSAKLTNEPIDHISILNGNVYFILNVFREETYLATIDKVSGEIIALNDDNAAVSLSVYDDRIYYISDTFNERYLKKYIDRETSETIIQKPVGSYLFADDCLLYTTYEPNKYMYRANQDGTSESLLTPNEVLFFQYENNQIFYIEKESYSLHKLDIASGVDTVILDTDIGGFIVDKGWIYFPNLDDNGFLYKVKTDGSNMEKMASLESFGIQIFGERIVYESNEKMYWIKKDGSCNDIIFDD